MTIKTEHAGAKNGGGFWGRRVEAKALSKVARRQRDKAVAVAPVIDMRADHDQLDPHPSGYSPQNVLEVAKQRSKKDTKRWCLGKVGRAHKPTTKEDVSTYSVYRLTYCTVCKKHLKSEYKWKMR